MALTTSAYHTHAPFHPAIKEALRHRRYALKVTFPDGRAKQYTSLAHFTQSLGKRLEHIRTRAIYAEMDIGDTANAEWLDANNQAFHFTFIRVR